MYREEPLNKQLSDLRKEVEGLKGNSPASYYLLFDLNEWRWPLAVVACAAIACLTLPASLCQTESEETETFTERESSTSVTFTRPTMRPVFTTNHLDGGLPAGGVSGCTWDSPDADDCGYASGFGGGYDDAYDEILNQNREIQRLQESYLRATDTVDFVCDSSAPDWNWTCHIEPGTPARFEQWVDMARRFAPLIDVSAAISAGEH